ncbi:MAG: hypothetical protein U0S36_14000 [Candidatus Nanopelagicales bacterium]
MGLVLPDRWIWDFWLVQDGLDHHVFFLQAAHEIGHPDERHWNVSIGHAVSRDLVDWELLPDALAPGPAGAWDDASTWTGSIVRHDGRWHLLYTGTSTRDDRLVQRVGLATSDDLVVWTKHDGPVLESDPRWYETVDMTTWHDQAWRDPWVWWDAEESQFHALVTARVREGERGDRGTVAHATSPDLVTWTVLPPVTPPLGFGQLGVPQVTEVDGRWYLVFCSDTETQGSVLAEQLGTGTFYLVGDSPTGPFRRVGSGVLEADAQGSTYAGKLHRDNDGRLVFLAWHRTGPDGSFRGELSDPQLVSVRPDSTLALSPLAP